MKWFLIALCGIVGGIFGGLGMGGGTLLIPMLVNFFNVEQKIAQSINLISFLPTSIVALVVHIKKKRVDFKGVLYIIIPAVLSSVLGSVLAGKLGNETLKKCFGFFLIALAFFNAYTLFKNEKEQTQKVDITTLLTISILCALKIPWPEEPGSLQSMEWLRVGHD